MDAKEFFLKNISDYAVIPNLLKVLEDLKPIRTNEQATEQYIQHWCNNLTKQVKTVPNDKGELVSADIQNPDISRLQRNVSWLKIYFDHLSKQCKEKTISYAFAYVYTVQLYNRWNSKIQKLPPHDMDDIHKALEINDQYSDKDNPKYPIDDNLLILKVYNSCSHYKVIEITFPNFLNMVENADFSEIKPSAKYKLQFLIFKLNNAMGNKWYTDAVESIQSTKSLCGATRTKLEANNWAQEISDILKTPHKKA